MQIHALSLVWLQHEAKDAPAISIEHNAAIRVASDEDLLADRQRRPIRYRIGRKDEATLRPTRARVHTAEVEGRVARHDVCERRWDAVRREALADAFGHVERH